MAGQKPAMTKTQFSLIGKRSNPTARGRICSVCPNRRGRAHCAIPRLHWLDLPHRRGHDLRRDATRRIGGGVIGMQDVTLPADMLHEAGLVENDRAEPELEVELACLELLCSPLLDVRCGMCTVTGWFEKLPMRL